MTPLEVCRRALDEIGDPRNCNGVLMVRGEVLAPVPARDLARLLAEYETMDSELRSLQSSKLNIYVPAGKRLFDNILACYHEYGKNYERTFLVIMDALHPLLQDKQKKDIEQQFTAPKRGW